MRIITYTITAFMVGAELGTHHIRISLGWVGVCLERTYLCDHCSAPHWPSGEWLSPPSHADDDNS